MKRLNYKQAHPNRFKRLRVKTTYQSPASLVRLAKRKIKELDRINSRMWFEECNKIHPDLLKSIGKGSAHYESLYFGTFNRIEASQDLNVCGTTVKPGESFTLRDPHNPLGGIVMIPRNFLQEDPRDFIIGTKKAELTAQDEGEIRAALSYALSQWDDLANRYADLKMLSIYNNRPRRADYLMRADFELPVRQRPYEIIVPQGSVKSDANYLKVAPHIYKWSGLSEVYGTDVYRTAAYTSGIMHINHFTNIADATEHLENLNF